MDHDNIIAWPWAMRPGIPNAVRAIGFGIHEDTCDAAARGVHDRFQGNIGDFTDPES